MIFILFISLSIIDLSSAQKIVLPQEFGAVYFGTVVGKAIVNQAVVGEIYLSKKQEKGAVITRQAFDVSYEIFDYKSKQVLVASGNGRQCEVKSIDMFTEGVNPQVFMDMMSNNLVQSKVPVEVNGIPATDWLNGTQIVSKFADSKWKFFPAFGSWSYPLYLTLTQPELLGEVNYTYFFMNVFESIPEEVFVPPHGILCPGFNNDAQQLPPLAEKFRVDVESVSNFTQTNLKIFCDNEAKVIREDFLIGPGQSYSLVIDKNYGITYKIDYDTERCLSTSAHDPRQLSTPNQLMYDVGAVSTFYYRGNRRCWQGVCEVWSGASEESIHEIYFKKVMLKSGAKDYRYVPVKMDTQPLSNFPIVDTPAAFHYFNYESDYSDWTKFDVSDCYDEKYKLRFQVSLEGKLSTIANPQDFQRQFRLAVINLTEVPQMRFHKLRLDNFNDELVMVTLTALEEPKFAGLNTSQVYGVNSYIYISIANAINKGRFIVKTKNIAGKEIAFTGVAINRNVISKAKIDEIGTSLLKFTRNQSREFQITTSDLVIEASLTVDACAKQCDRELTSKCDLFMFCKDTQRCVLSTSLFEDRTDVVPSAKCDVYVKDYASDFNLLQRNRMPFNAETDTKMGDMDLRDCFSQCFLGKMNTSSCHSIDFCSDGQHRTCVFHALHFTQIKRADLVPDETCLHYSMKFVSMFHAFPNKSVKNSSTNFVSIIYDVPVRDCAKNCLLDVAGCTDFEMCTLFDSTESKTVCRIMEAKASTLGQDIEYETNVKCDHYRLKGLKTEFDFSHFRTDEPPVVPTSETRLTQKNAPFTPGEMAALGIAMVIAGFAIGFSLVYFYAKKQYTKGNDTNFIMQLVKD